MRALPVEQPVRLVANLRAPVREGHFLGLRNAGIVGVAQHEIGKRCAFARRFQARPDGAQPGKGACGVFVAQRHQDGGANGNWCRAIAGGGKRRHQRQRILMPAQQVEAEQRIPDAQYAPRCGDGKAGEDQDVDHAPAAGAKNCRQPGEQAEIDRAIDEGCDNATATQLRSALRARRGHRLSGWHGRQGCHGALRLVAVEFMPWMA